MRRIGVLSDTHGIIPKQVYSFFNDCDELWHAGDLGRGVYERLSTFKPLHAVYGNIDDHSLRYSVPASDLFTCEGLKILLTHIGGWPGHYSPAILNILRHDHPDIFVCGHSHILKVMYDHELNLLHINPGAAGRQGFHKVGTLVRFTIDGTPKDLEIMEFDKLNIEDCKPL
ncbi:MAG: metallophosphoesterase family protein [Bacteroidales bacterium]|nr:metallophosphoesterase family protein [Bacteroidales bacterium]